MSNTQRGPILLAILVITLGIGWLLTVKDVFPGINWLWTLSLALVGLFTFITSGGFNKYTLVVGTFFLLASLISVLRQSGYMELNVEVPVLFIIFGILLLLSQHPGVPFPAWYSPPADKK